MDELLGNVWCSADIEVSSAKTEACVRKKNGINKSAIIKKCGDIDK